MSALDDIEAMLDSSVGCFDCELQLESHTEAMRKLIAVARAAEAYRASFDDWSAPREGHAKLVLYSALDALATGKESE